MIYFLALDFFEIHFNMLNKHCLYKKMYYALCRHYKSSILIENYDALMMLESIFLKRNTLFQIHLLFQKVLVISKYTHIFLILDYYPISPLQIVIDCA